MVKRPNSFQAESSVTYELINKALEGTFMEYQNKELSSSGKGPICDSDKQTLKHNTRKHALFEAAYQFCSELFGIDKDQSMTPK